MTHPFLNHKGVIPFAHRGGARDFLENTRRAFQASFDLGYRYLETDAHLSQDGVIYAFHDPDLSRITDRVGRIAELPSTEIDQVRVGGTEPIPRLETLLTDFPAGRFNIDPKSDAVIGPLGDLIERLDLFSRVCVTSVHDARQARLRRRFGARLCTGMGQRSVLRMIAASWYMPVGRFTEQCAQVPIRAHGIEIVTPRFLRACHKRGVAVHVWTIDDPEEMTRLVNLGVDGIMTDRPETLWTVLKKTPITAER